MTVRMIDPWVNVTMGGGQAPDWLIRVKEDYFRAGDEFTQDISEEKLLADMDAAGVEKAILSIPAKSPEPRVLALAKDHPRRFAYAVSVDPRKLMRELAYPAFCVLVFLVLWPVPYAFKEGLDSYLLHAVPPFLILGGLAYAAWSQRAACVRCF